MRQSLIVLTLAGVCTVALAACAASQPPPPTLAEDPTASSAARTTDTSKCRWVPALPADQEDRCTETNAGATLDLTEREDMRAENAVSQTHICTCE